MNSVYSLNGSSHNDNCVKLGHAVTFKKYLINIKLVESCRADVNEAMKSTLKNTNILFSIRFIAC